MKSLTLLILSLLLTGCLNFSPVSVKSFPVFSGEPILASNCSDDNKVCKTRAYTLSVAEKYKDKLRSLFDSNSYFDSWLLNLVTLGVGGGLAESHVDVTKVTGLSIGYFTAYKSYESIPFQIEVYTNAMVASQCVYETSRRLDEGQKDLVSIKSGIKYLRQNLYILRKEPIEVQKLINKEAKYLISFDSLVTELEKTITQAEKAKDELEEAPNTIINTMSIIDRKTYKLFQGKLPDITSITAQLEKEIKERLSIEANGEPSSLPLATTEHGLTNDTTKSYAYLRKPLKEALLANQTLTDFPLIKYATDSTKVTSCSASL